MTGLDKAGSPSAVKRARVQEPTGTCHNSPLRSAGVQASEALRQCQDEVPVRKYEEATFRRREECASLNLEPRSAALGMAYAKRVAARGGRSCIFSRPPGFPRAAGSPASEAGTLCRDCTRKADCRLR